jgi:hypothetical protein
MIIWSVKTRGGENTTSYGGQAWTLFPFLLLRDDYELHYPMLWGSEPYRELSRLGSLLVKLLDDLLASLDLVKMYCGYMARRRRCMPLFVAKPSFVLKLFILAGWPRSWIPDGRRLDGSVAHRTSLTIQ